MVLIIVNFSAIGCINFTISLVTKNNPYSLFYLFVCNKEVGGPTVTTYIYDFLK